VSTSVWVQLNNNISAKVLQRRVAIQRRRTAYHEAGHALVHMYFGERFHRLLLAEFSSETRSFSPIEDRRGNTLNLAGFTDQDNSVPTSIPRQELPAKALPLLGIEVEKELINCHAGIAAEARVRRSYFAAILEGGQGDMERARVLVNWWCASPDQKHSLLSISEKRAKALIGSDPGWKTICRIAEALESTGTVEFEVCRNMFEQSYGVLPTSLPSWYKHWPPGISSLRSGKFPPSDM
jgi:hypothetical protein